MQFAFRGNSVIQGLRIKAFYASFLQKSRGFGFGIMPYAYDARGNMTSTTNALNQTTTITYDDEGRVISVTDPLNE